MVKGKVKYSLLKGKDGDSHVLRNLKQPGFVESTSNERSCEKMLEKSGFYTDMRSYFKRPCPSCKKVGCLSYDKTKHVMRCWKCKVRVHRPHLAWTIKGSYASAGCLDEVTARDIVGAAYLLGVRTPVDSARLIMGHATEKTVRNLFTKMKLAMAFAEWRVTSHLKFREVTEVDASKTQVCRTDANKRIHKGRVLAIVSRQEQNKRVIIPLPDRTTKGNGKKARGIGAESCEEVVGVMASRLKNGTVLSSDSGAALKKGGRAAGKSVPHVSVRHGTRKDERQWVKMCKLPVSKMTKAVKENLKKFAPSPKSGAKSAPSRPRKLSEAQWHPEAEYGLQPSGRAHQDAIHLVAVQTSWNRRRASSVEDPQRRS
eukprot:TRINITY_DN14974_c0_g1_i1.p1 TRINITY_DN14974_c0_g1~~TRINITY_DN14974_c0_g1_i1.p1  ORF type:complete len:371 (+),score=65.58 TRINITY_DN14974_c0_g1_i1:89-1201(+)